MRIKLLDKLTGEWARQWIITWFIIGVIALTTGFWLKTDHTLLDVFYLAVSIIGLICVVSLSFRKNTLGNGLGMVATAGEVVVQSTAGSVGLMLAPMFNFLTHVYGLMYWSKNTDPDGDMIPKSGTKWMWLVTILFIILGLALFPVVNDWLHHMGFSKIFEKENRSFLGLIDFFWLNVLAFILAIIAQATMILRYSFNWWIWIASNFVWLLVNLMTQNYIFAIQTIIYQINAFIGLYEWHTSELEYQQKNN